MASNAGLSGAPPWLRNLGLTSWLLVGFALILVAFGWLLSQTSTIVMPVPLSGTIAVVTFVTAYGPIIAAWTAGIFAFVIALGSEGTTDALILAVVILLANGALQNILQPFVFGATLQLNPLAVLVVTIGAGCLFGLVGLTLAAPLTSAAVHISTQLRARDRQAAAADPAHAPGDGRQPAPT